MVDREIERRAITILEAVKFDPRVSRGVDIVRTADFFGIEVEQIQLPEEIEGAIVVGQDGKKISIQNALSIPKKRFVIGHELCWYLLRYEGIAPFSHKKRRSAADAESAYFARLLLMPSPPFAEDWIRYRSAARAAQELALVYNVPTGQALARILEVFA